MLHESELQKLPILLLQDPDSQVAEAYRSLRTSLSKHIGEGKTVIMSCSAWAGDGKSMVSSNLAVALAQFNYRVLLIDGDLRKPTITRVFSASELPGITDCLDDELEWKTAVYPTIVDNLSLMPRGKKVTDPSSLLHPTKLRRLFSQLRLNFDCVIMDSSPLCACSDPLMLGAIADGAVMVVSPKGWDGELEVRYKQQLKQHGIPLLGAILNNVGANARDTYGSYGSYGYGGYGSYGAYGKAYGSTSDSNQRRSWLDRLKGLWTRPD